MRDIRAAAATALADYLRQFPDEAPLLRRLAVQLADCSADPFSRKNMSGHVTTSAFVVDPSARLILLIRHRALGTWLQPGGHFEPDPGEADPSRLLWGSAAREVTEETGVREFQPLYPLGPALLPLDIDSHAIPPRIDKGEGAHEHHDFGFVAVADSAQPLAPQLSEVRDAQWTPIDVAGARGNARLRRTIGKIETLRLI